MYYSQILRLVASLLALCYSGVKSYAVDAGVQGYMIIIDAGSSGSRIRIYDVGARTDPQLPPSVQESYSYKVKPGISSYALNIEGLGDHIRSLVNKAKEQLKPKFFSTTPIYLMATAGMRLLMEDHASEIIAKIDSLLSNKEINPFIYKSQNCRILSGEEEGVFSWLAVNYLEGYFKAPDKKASIGVLEMGGASTQIAFVPESPILADKFPVKVASRFYDIYVHSYLHYGQKFVWIWACATIVRNNTIKREYPNPCMLKGDVKNQTIKDKEYTFRGTGNAEECQTVLETLVHKANPLHCYPKPCGIGTVYQPTIPDSMVFYAISSFKYSLIEMNVLKEDGSFTPRETREAVSTYCAQDYAEVAATSDKPTFLSSNCLMGVYIPLLITHGYSFSEDTTNIRVVDKIDGQPAVWTLGAAVYENEKKCNSRHIAMATISSGNKQTETSYFCLFVILLTISIYNLKIFSS